MVVSGGRGTDTHQTGVDGVQREELRGRAAVGDQDERERGGSLFFWGVGFLRVEKEQEKLRLTA
jgi:hypothetical protein